MRVLALLLLTACGRVAFDAMPATDDAPANGAVDASVSTGPTGPRWLKRFGNAGARTAMAGAAGALTVAQGFSGTLAGDGVTFTGLGFVSTGLARYAADGELQSSRLYDAEGFCDLRHAVADGDAVILAGFTQGAANPARGICSIAASRQEPIALRLAADGTETVVAHWVASTTNAQGWSLARFGNGELVVFGVYSGELMTDTQLPTAGADPNAFIARPLIGSPTGATWSHALVSPGVIYAGPAAAAATRAYFVGSFAGTPTLLGTPVASAGGIDAFIARVDADGSPVFVRAIGSTANEPDFGNTYSIAALEDGSVVVAFETTGDVTFDSQTFPAADGTGLVMHLDGTGALLAGRRFAQNGPIAAIGSSLYMAQHVGGDVHIVELDATLATARTVGVIGGAGVQSSDRLVPVGPDALAISGSSSGALVFGTTMFDTGGATVRYVGVVGL